MGQVNSAFTLAIETRAALTARAASAQQQLGLKSCVRRRRRRQCLSVFPSLCYPLPPAAIRRSVSVTTDRQHCTTAPFSAPHAAKARRRPIQSGGCTTVAPNRSARVPVAPTPQFNPHSTSWWWFAYLHQLEPRLPRAAKDEARKQQLAPFVSLLLRGGKS